MTTTTATAHDFAAWYAQSFDGDTSVALSPTGACFNKMGSPSRSPYHSLNNDAKKAGAATAFEIVRQTPAQSTGRFEHLTATLREKESELAAVTATIVDKDSDLQLAREYGQMLLALLEQERIAADARLLEAEDQLAHKSGQ